MTMTRRQLTARNRELEARLATAAPETRAGLRRKVADALSRAEVAERRAHALQMERDTLLKDYLKIRDEVEQLRNEGSAS